jgi:hypothetical protein
MRSPTPAPAARVLERLSDGVEGGFLGDCKIDRCGDATLTDVLSTGSRTATSAFRTAISPPPELLARR